MDNVDFKVELVTAKNLSNTTQKCCWVEMIRYLKLNFILYNSAEQIQFNLDFIMSCCQDWYSERKRKVIFNSTGMHSIKN